MLSVGPEAGVTDLFVLAGGGSATGSGPSEWADELPSETGQQRILLVAFCRTCHAQAIRKFDLEGIELVIQPWEHRQYRSDHEVTGVEIEDPRVEHRY